MTEPGEFAMWLAIGAGQVAFWAAVSPLIKAGADRIRAKGQSPIADAEGRLAELEAVLERMERIEHHVPITGEVEAQDRRLAELEERLDFTERLLTRVDAGSRHLPPSPAAQVDS